MKIKNLEKNFGGIQAVNEISLEIPKGEITAIIGPNGSGKTTLFNLISGIMREDNGSIFLDGKNISSKMDFERSQEGISRTFQHVRLFDDLTIKEHFEVSLEDDKNLLGKVFGTKKDMNKEIKEILKEIGLDKSLDTKAEDLSYGQKKLLDIGIRLLKSYKVLLLDEPVAGVNPALRKDIKNLIKRLSRENRTVVIIEHDMEFVMDLADKVICLEEGKVIFEGSPKEAQKNIRVLEAYLGK